MTYTYITAIFDSVLTSQSQGHDLGSGALKMEPEQPPVAATNRRKVRLVLSPSSSISFNKSSSVFLFRAEEAPPIANNGRKFDFL